MLWFVRRMKRILGRVGFCTDNVEVWPLVQAYALDIFGLGFFSKEH